MVIWTPFHASLRYTHHLQRFPQAIEKPALYHILARILHRASESAAWPRVNDRMGKHPPSFRQTAICEHVKASALGKLGTLSLCILDALPVAQQLLKRR